MRNTQIIRHVILALGVAGIATLVMMRPPIPQDPSYHLFADDRSWLGIPNFLNVASNLPFAIVGLLGLVVTFRYRPAYSPTFSDPWERWPYATLFAGTALTALGSSYYHLAPDNGRLVWDRLPMTLGFMGLLTAVLAERVNLTSARYVFTPLLGLGAVSVAYWYWSEARSHGDLRFYLLVQFGSLLFVVLLILLYPRRYLAPGYLVAGLGAYAAAKGLELSDRGVFALGQVISGHTLKHLVAATGVACLVAMLHARVSGLTAEAPPN